MTGAASQTELMADLARVFADFQGREYSGLIDAGTRFFADLGLASIDAVVLGETLQERYRRSLPFGTLMADLGRREDRDMTIGELAAFLARHIQPEDLPMPKIDVAGRKFHVQQAGQGPDVVLIHGVTGDLSIWFLCKAMTELAADHRVTAFDLRGHGYSDVPPDGYTSADHATDLFALMDGLGIEKARLVGHSFGGVIAAHAAVLRPERVEGVVFSDPYFPALRHLEDASKWKHWQSFRTEAEEAGVVLSDEFWYDLDKFFDQVMHLDAEKMLKFRHAVGLPAMQRLLRLGRTTCGADAKAVAGLTEDLIRGISAPSLALFGEKSPFLATMEYLAEHLPNCRAETVPDAKHRAPEENPEGFVMAVRSFLDSLEPAGVAR